MPAQELLEPPETEMELECDHKLCHCPIKKTQEFCSNACRQAAEMKPDDICAHPGEDCDHTSCQCGHNRCGDHTVT